MLVTLSSLLMSFCPSWHPHAHSPRYCWPCPSPSPLCHPTGHAFPLPLPLLSTIASSRRSCLIPPLAPLVNPRFTLQVITSPSPCASCQPSLHPAGHAFLLPLPLLSTLTSPCRSCLPPPPAPLVNSRTTLIVLLPPPLCFGHSSHHPIGPAFPHLHVPLVNLCTSPPIIPSPPLPPFVSSPAGHSNGCKPHSGRQVRAASRLRGPLVEHSQQQPSAAGK